MRDVIQVTAEMHAVTNHDQPPEEKAQGAPRSKRPRRLVGQGEFHSRDESDLGLGILFFFLAARCHAGSWFPYWDGTRGPRSGSVAS